MYVSTNKIIHINYLCQLVHVHICDNYVSIYASYEVTAINSMTRGTGIQTFHITDICHYEIYPPIVHISYCTSAVVYI